MMVQGWTSTFAFFALLVCFAEETFLEVLKKNKKKHAHRKLCLVFFVASLVLILNQFYFSYF